jgi:hypothetical protein
MATVCGQIASNILKSCTKPLQGGTKDRALIINFEDIASIVYNGTNVSTVEDIVLKTSKLAYQIDGKNNSIAPKAMLVKQGYENMFDHSVQLKGFDISPEIKEHFNSGKDGRYVVIVENYFKGTAGNSAFEIYGLTSGLELTALERDPNNADTQGAFDFTFSTVLNKEPKLPNNLFITSYALSKAVVDGLLS